MAPGCETECITRLIQLFRPHASGICLAGAGGGGFMYVLAKDAAHKEQIQHLVAQTDVSQIWAASWQNQQNDYVPSEDWSVFVMCSMGS